MGVSEALTSLCVPSAAGTRLFCCVRAKSLWSCRLCMTPRTGARQAPLSMGFSRQEYWGGLPLPSPDLPHPGIEPASLVSPALAGRFSTLSTAWGAFCWHHLFKSGDGNFKPAQVGLWVELQCKNEVSFVGNIDISVIMMYIQFKEK